MTITFADRVRLAANDIKEYEYKVIVRQGNRSS